MATHKGSFPNRSSIYSLFHIVHRSDTVTVFILARFYFGSRHERRSKPALLTRVNFTAGNLPSEGTSITAGDALGIFSEPRGPSLTTAAASPGWIFQQHCTGYLRNDPSGNPLGTYESQLDGFVDCDDYCRTAAILTCCWSGDRPAPSYVFLLI